MNSMYLSSSNAMYTQRQELFRIFVLLLVMTLIMLASPAAFAQDGTIGADGWTKLKAVWFGYPGLIAGVLIFGISVQMFISKGFLACLGVVAAGVFFFFLPALTTAIQSMAKGA